MSPAPLQLTVNLSVARMESGGNTADGKYFFAFERNRIVIEERSTLLTFALAPETPTEFVIETLISSDARGELGEPTVASDLRSVSVIVNNHTAYLMQIGLLLFNTKTKESIVCDPQVICRPRPGP